MHIAFHPVHVAAAHNSSKEASMGSSLRLVLGICIGLSVGVAGCADVPTSPLADEFESIVQAPFFERAPAPGFDVLKRTLPLDTDVTVDAVIGEQGGWIRLDQAGISVFFPKGALMSETHVSLTAFAGDRVAFEFAPHGLTFDRPVELRIDARVTEAVARLGTTQADETPVGLAPREDFLGVYFEGKNRRGVRALETFPVSQDENDLVFETVHFSGYACASG
jgi:hypothetical protein